MRVPTALGAAALLLTLAACGKEATSDPYVAALPDAQGLALEVQGGAPEGIASSKLAVEAALSVTPDASDDVQVARARIKQVNQAVEAVLAHVAAVAQANGVPQPGEVMVYGPVDRCVVAGDPCPAGGTATLKLAVRHFAGATYAFDLQALVGDAYEPVVAGWITRGAAEHRGVGKIAIDLEHLRAAAPAFKGQGYLLGGFASGPVAKALTYKLVGFTFDVDAHAPVTVAFRGFKTAAGTTRVRAVALADLVAGPNGDELGFARVAYNPAVGGRAFAIVTNHLAGGTGDVPNSAGGAPQYFFGRACYAPGSTTAAFKEWFLCLRSEGPFACVNAAGGVGTQVAGVPGATWASTCQLATEPSELAPPAGAPGDDPGDTSSEQGESAAGLAPPAPPVDQNDTAPTA
jgi:hypothetical protein